MKAYLDTMTGSILSVEDWKALGLDTFPKDMGLEPIYKGLVIGPRQDSMDTSRSLP
jgi:hypothetical protein